MIEQTNKELIDLVLNSPSAPTLVERLNKILTEEKRQRQQFYRDISEEKKAEFINGKIIIHPPDTLQQNKVCTNIYKILNTYVQKHQLGYVGLLKIMIQFSRNAYEPDLCFFKQEIAQEFKDDQDLFPVPNLIIEVLSPFTEKRDRGVKLEDYQAHGVEEYWIVDTEEQYIEQYLMKDGAYELNVKSGTGELQAIAIQGFTFPIQAAFNENIAHKVMKTILS